MKPNITQILEQESKNTLAQDLSAKFDKINKFDQGTKRVLVADLTNCFKNPRTSKSIILLRELKDNELKFDCDSKNGLVDPVEFNRTVRIRRGLLSLQEQQQGRG